VALTMTQSSFRQAVEDLDEARTRGDIDDERWFSEMASVYDAAYLVGDNPRAQSGFGGDETRWYRARRPIADLIDEDGTFLDIGCASGYLMESMVRWTPHHIEPYGLELAPGLAELARRRLPDWADRIFIGNALTWEPPKRFDFVRTELVYVPTDQQYSFVKRLLAEIVAPGGLLIACGYGSRRQHLQAQPVQQLLRSYGINPELEISVEAPEGEGPIVQIAAVRASISGTPAGRTARAF
jgi:SAM-dependent methyltransferase